MISAQSIRREFRYRRPATTSRGTYLTKTVWFIILTDPNDAQRVGIGECSLFPGLSHDDLPGFDAKVDEVIGSINREGMISSEELQDWPSIRFALETAGLDFASEDRMILFPSAFTDGAAAIRINGLIWMGERKDMISQIRGKLDEGFSCLKMKIGSIGISEELEIIRMIRDEYDPATLELRVDANGAFQPGDVMPVLDRLTSLGVHSIEQPLRQGQAEAMAKLCEESPLPVALDEELIGIHETGEKSKLLDSIRPHYIILKPGLLGGIGSAAEWQRLALERGVGYWVTSALETNIGLNAIAQWTYTLESGMPQGLSTGSLFEDNIPSPLHIRGEMLMYSREKRWDLSGLTS